MELKIHRGGNRSFILKDFYPAGFRVFIATGDDLIKVFQWANEEFKRLREVGAFDERGACYE